MEQIEGQVERVTFFNEENGFAVLRVKVRGQRDLVTVLGALPTVNGGEWIHAVRRVGARPAARSPVPRGNPPRGARRTRARASKNTSAAA